MSNSIITIGNISTNARNLLKNVDKNLDNSISVKEYQDSNISKEKLIESGISLQDANKIEKSFQTHKYEKSDIVFNITPEKNNIPKEVKPAPSPNNNESIKIKIDFIYDKLKNTPNELRKFESLLNKKREKGESEINIFLNKSINTINKSKLNVQEENLSILSGTNKGVKSILTNKEDSEKLTNDYINTIKNFKGIHNINISEKRTLSDSAKDFWDVFNISESPRTSKKLSKESATTETIMYDEQLRKKILNTEKDNLTPSDIIKYSLEITKGDYQKAVLSVHNVFKSVCYDLREAQNSKDNINNFFDSKSKNYNINQLKPSVFNDDLKIVGKLSNLRENSSNNNDKMGMWYHFFGVQSMCSRNGVGKAYLAISGEHSARIFKYFHLIEGQSPRDTEKATLDNLSYNIFLKINK